MSPSHSVQMCIRHKVLTRGNINIEKPNVERIQVSALSVLSVCDEIKFPILYDVKTWNLTRNI